MQEILDIFLEKSKQHHSNIIYAQIYKNDLLKEEFRLFPVKTRLNIWSISKPFVAMAAGIAEREGLITLDEYIYPWFEKYFPSDPSENLYKIKIRSERSALFLRWTRTVHRKGLGEIFLSE